MKLIKDILPNKALYAKKVWLFLPVLCSKSVTNVCYLKGI